MFDDPLERLPRKVQALKVGIAVLQLGDHAEGLDVVVKAAIGLHALLQLILARMAKGRVAKVMGESDGFAQIRIQSHRRGDRPRNLSNLERVGQTGAEVVAFMGDKDLRLFLQPAKGRGVDDPIPVAGKGRASAAVLFLKPAALGMVGVFSEQDTRGGMKNRHLGFQMVRPNQRPSNISI